MDEYIKKSSVINVISEPPEADYMDEYTSGYRSCALDVQDAIEDIPAADVVPVVHGYWKSYSGRRVEISEEGYLLGECSCSVCGDWLVASDEYYVKGRFCPNCGAKMDGERKE